jgi:hypothetical protein
MENQVGNVVFLDDGEGCEVFFEAVLSVAPAARADFWFNGLASSTLVLRTRSSLGFLGGSCWGVDLGVAPAVRPGFFSFVDERVLRWCFELARP